MRIKRFFSTSVYAVKTQRWIAESVYVLVAIVKKETESVCVVLHFAADFVGHPV